MAPKLHRLGLTAALILTSPLAAQDAVRPFDAVDPFIGTGGEGHTFPARSRRSGWCSCRPTPTPRCVIRDCYGHAAGYRYEDPTIQGFSHTHFSGAGHSDLGDILVMPVSGDTVPTGPGRSAGRGSGYRSRFAMPSEIAQPGYYAVTLDGPAVRAETDRRHAHRRPPLQLSRGHARRIWSSTCARRSTIIPARSCGRGCTCAPTAR